MSAPLPKPDLRRWTHLLAFGFGSGLAPKAPGTFGTLAAIPLFWALAGLPLWLYLSVTLAAFVLGVYVCERTSRDLGVHDHSGIVWDEVVGFLLTMAWVPRTWPWVIGGFLLFRLFDIWKPYPIRQLDAKVGGGFGIMLDDVAAAVYAGAVLTLVFYMR